MSVASDQTVYSDELDKVIMFIEQEIHREGATIANDGTVTIPVEELWKKS